MWQRGVVIVLVSAAAVYVLWMLTPALTRFVALGAAERRLSTRSGAAPRWLLAHVVLPLRRRVAQRAGCGSCPVAPPPAARRDRPSSAR
jgi:hypothetical protein